MGRRRLDVEYTQAVDPETVGDTFYQIRILRIQLKAMGADAPDVSSEAQEVGLDDVTHMPILVIGIDKRRWERLEDAEDYAVYVTLRLASAMTDVPVARAETASPNLTRLVFDAKVPTLTFTDVVLASDAYAGALKVERRLVPVRWRLNEANGKDEDIDVDYALSGGPWDNLVLSDELGHVDVDANDISWHLALMSDVRTWKAEDECPEGSLGMLSPLFKAETPDGDRTGIAWDASGSGISDPPPKNLLDILLTHLDEDEGRIEVLGVRNGTDGKVFHVPMTIGWRTYDDDADDDEGE